ncbi:class I SAM-dependent methyltransferase [Hoeflea olei]|uniref:class I SAM-dependent methyltransferase n=1 Tax=Hoeflea olei TaxID=1480615 RepID=UPI0014955282|nr:class I SAM-dependent methyltransferase [Hoeflea olei]
MDPRGGRHFGKSASDLAWSHFWLSALELKRTLDRKTPFDFPAKVKAGRVLLVGEGNLSFSLALARKVGVSATNMISTTFETVAEYSEATVGNAIALRRLGVTVVPGVDARNLTNWFGRGKFGSIVFQFPNVGSRNPLHGRNPNHILVRRFLESASEHLVDDGVVAITAVNSPHYDGAFDVDGAAERNQYDIPVAHPFYFSDYPGYTHVKTKDDGSGALDAGDEFVTFAFQKKRQAVRKWGHR